MTPTLTPLWPIIGLISASSLALFKTIFALLTSFAFPCDSNFWIFSTNSSGLGKNSCNGGSSNLIVTSYPSIAFRILIKSLFCNWPSLFKILLLSSIFSAIIISTNKLILSLPLNILSVLHSPIPWPPNFLASLAPSGVSALALIPSVFVFCAHSKICSKSFVTFGSTVGISPINTVPSLPSIVIVSPSLIVISFAIAVLLS